MQLAQIPSPQEAETTQQPSIRQAPAVQAQERMKDPQYMPSVGRYNPRAQIPENVDMTTNPEAWVQKLIKDDIARSARDRTPRRYASTFIAFKDKDDPTKVVAVLPIELESGKPSRTTDENRNDFPRIFLDIRDAADVTDIDFQNKTATGEASYTGTPQVDGEKSKFKDSLGYGPEGGSTNTIRIRMRIQSRSETRISLPTDNVYSAHGFISYDSDGLPARYLPLASSVLREPTEQQLADKRFPKITVQGRTYIEISDGNHTKDNQQLLKAAGVSRDAAEVSVQEQRWAPVATVDYEKKTVDGGKTTYPITFTQEEKKDDKFETSGTISGTLVIGDGDPRVEPADNVRLQNAFASMQVTIDPLGKPVVQRWNPTPTVSGPELNAIVKIGDESIHAQTVLPVELQSHDQQHSAHAYLYVDSENKVHILDKSKVTLVRPKLDAATAVEGKENTFSSTLTLQQYNTDTKEYDSKAIPILITQNGESYTVSYNEDRKAINTGENGSLTVEKAKAELLAILRAGQLDIQPVEDSPPVLSIVLPEANEKATGVSFTTAEGILNSLNLVGSRENGVPTARTTSAPLSGRTFAMNVELANGQTQNVSFDGFLPLGVEMSTPRLGQMTLLNGQKVLPFTFATSKPVNGETSHTGYFRIEQDGLKLRSVGSSGSVRLDSDLYISGIRVFPGHHADRHTDGGFIKLEPEQK